MYSNNLTIQKKINFFICLFLKVTKDVEAWMQFTFKLG